MHYVVTLVTRPPCPSVIVHKSLVHLDGGAELLVLVLRQPEPWSRHQSSTHPSAPLDTTLDTLNTTFGGTMIPK